MQKANIKIVVIGAGSAGLASAVKLLEYGYENVKILEAESRIGGRIKSTKFNNRIIDEGAQWCHGEEGNIVYNLVKNLNMLQSSKCDYADNQFYDSKGEAIDKDLTGQLYNIAMNINYDAAALDGTALTFGDYFIESYTKEIQTLNLNEKEAKIAHLFIDWYHKLTLCYDAALNWNDISSSGLNTYKNCDGDLLLNWRDKGFVSFLDVLMQRTNGISALDTKILLNKKVAKIHWGGRAIKIHCDSGEVFDADHVIVTPSVGVLKARHRSLFVPQLPAYKISAIGAIGFGAIRKLFIKFPYNWWGDETSLCFLYSEQDRRDLISEFPEGPIKNGKLWLEDVFGAFVIDSDPTVLLVWMVGELTKESELLTDEVVKNGLTYLLNKFLSKKYTIPPIQDIKCTKWATNDNFRGTYSYMSVKYEQENIETSYLSDPICNADHKPIIQFAGEATHPHYFSTVHGAVETGYREAKRIADYYKLFTAKY